MNRLTIDDVNNEVASLNEYVQACCNIGSVWDKADVEKVRYTINMMSATINALIQGRVEVHEESKTDEEETTKTE